MKKVKKETKITDEELKSIKEQQEQVNTSLRNIGYYEVQKHVLEHKYAKLVEKIETTKKELEEKYGSVSIDLETGICTPVEDKKVKE
tara:strand:+ start:298 stop:558 length:261 start_codon:yes stop_codon:yes gene_type:complete